MASASDPTARANIRIEIKNDFTEEMEVDNLEKITEADIEDGEISDSKSNDEINLQTRKLSNSKILASNRIENQWQNTDGGFTTGVDIFSKDEQEKLQTRAQRFGLSPSEIKSLTPEELQELHTSLGLTELDELDTRFEAIHMYGTSDMSTQDVFAYFGKYGPSSIEWINDESCNVVWLDKVSAARAFCALSKAVEGMPVSGKCDPFQDDEKLENLEPGRSILLKNREVILSDNGKIHISDIDIPIPPGYWRLGDPHAKAKNILLRFARRTDKKPLKAEKFSEYYRKYGNPNFGGLKGLISESKKKKMKGLLPEDKVPSGDPWGNLAKNWNNDFHEREPNSDLTIQPKTNNKSILNRLGANKRAISPEKSPEPEQKKSKIPRMRMYADEEEARLQKIKQLKKIKELEQIEQNMTQTPDLRNRIGRHAPPPKPAQSVEGEKIRPIRVEVRRKSEERIISDDESDLQTKQKSKVTVIVKKTAKKPTVASTIWSRLDLEKRKQQEPQSSDSESTSTSESESESEEEYNSATRHKFSKAINSRPGFNRDLKSRLGLNTDHKSPLRIEINNDHYKKS